MKEEIIKMARDSGMELYSLGKDREKFVFHLERFFHMAQAAEREEILKLCEPPENSHQYVHTFKKIIRARGQA